MCITGKVEQINFKTPHMLYLLWFLLSVALSLYLLYIGFNAIKYINEHMGLFAACVFTLWMLNTCNNTRKDNDEQGAMGNQYKSLYADSVIIGLNALPPITIGKNLMFSTKLQVAYGYLQQSKQPAPINAYVSFDGMNGPWGWKTVSIFMDADSAPNKFKYSVWGESTWKLLNATIYTEPKTSSGYFTLPILRER